MGDDPALTRGKDEPGRRHASEHHQTETRQDDEQEGLDALAVVAQREDRRHEGGSDEQTADDTGEVVEDRQVQARPVAPAAGQQRERDDGHRQNGLGVLRHPEDRRHQQYGVHREHEHPGLPAHGGPEAEQRSRRPRQGGHVVSVGPVTDPRHQRLPVPVRSAVSGALVGPRGRRPRHPGPWSQRVAPLKAHGKHGNMPDRRTSPDRAIGNLRPDPLSSEGTGRKRWHRFDPNR